MKKLNNISPPRGKFIVFEGGDGTGKTTHLQHLKKWLAQNLPPHAAGVKTTREPGGSALCSRIRKLILDPEEAESFSHKAELLLYAADRAQHVDEIIEPWLAAGYWVLCDRYTASTVAYQGYGRGFGIPQITLLNLFATGGLEPDLTICLTLLADTAQSRRRSRSVTDRIEQESEAFHKRVSDGFSEIPGMARVSNDSDERATANRIQDIVIQCLLSDYE